MAELTTIARPYAKAAFQFAQAASGLAQWEKMLGVAAVVAEDPAMRAFLAQPALSYQRKAESFAEVCGDDLLDESGRNFIALLAQNERLALLPAIFSMFHAFVAEQEAFVDAEIVSAHALEADETERLVAALTKRLGREVRATTSVDDSLIGGVVIRAGDTVIDGSVRGRLSRLAEQLNS
ncbi:MAG: F0F1 ATP synthase subunit delta [Alcanivorax sp.]|nr:F0F1 ATP synthase subunit delta [Alcanivorax sp.]